MWELPALYDHIKTCIDANVYDAAILSTTPQKNLVSSVITLNTTGISSSPMLD